VRQKHSRRGIRKRRIVLEKGTYRPTRTREDFADDTPHFDPAIEKDALYATIAALEKSWGTPGMAHAFSDLCAALARAEEGSLSLEQDTERDTAFEVHVLGWASGDVCP